MPIEHDIFFTKVKLTIIINQSMFNTKKIRIKNMVSSLRTDSLN